MSKARFNDAKRRRAELTSCLLEIARSRNFETDANVSGIRMHPVVEAVALIALRRQRDGTGSR
jgi:hypothetical protein